MTLQELLKYMLNNCKPYNKRKKSPLNRKNKLFKFVQNINQYFDMSKFPNFKIEASVGQTPKWGLTPWIRIYDPISSKNATKGFYVVYLFSSDLDRVYLSLNRGVTKFKPLKGRTKQNSLISSAAYCKNKLGIKNNFKINLGPYYTKNPYLTKEYEAANMYSICYSKAEILNKSINTALMNDLNTTMKLYKRLLNLQINPNSSKAKRLYQLKGRQIITVNTPISIGEHKHRTHHRNTPSPKPHNYPRIDKNNMTIGDYGEAIVMKKEEHIYRNNPQITVKHDSKETNDNADYDISIHDINKGVILKKIKVKTSTSSSKRSHFYISKDEVSCLISDPDKYELIRVYNIKDNKRPIYIFSINGRDLLNHLLFKPSSYKVSFNQPSDLDKKYLIHYFKNN